MKVFDAIVAGAGPAGLSTALTLQSRGWKVLVAEKCRVPRDKVCGGFIGPENLDFIKNLGIYADMKAKGAKEVSNVVLSSSRGKTVQIPITLNGSRHFGLAASRKLLDTALLETFVRRGGTVWDEHAVGSASRDGRFKVSLKNLRSGQPKDVSAHQYIQATGLRRPSEMRTEKMFWGISALFKDVKDMHDNVFLHLIHKGHLGINRFENNTVNVCYVADGNLLKSFNGDLEALFRHFKKSNPAIAAQLEGASRVTSWKGIPVVREVPCRFAEQGIFYAGDTVGAVHPIVGGGISLALSMGHELGNLLAAYAPDEMPYEKVLKDYRDLWHRKYFWRLRVSGILGRLSHFKPAADPILNLMSVHSGFMETLFKFQHRSMALQLSV